MQSDRWINWLLILKHRWQSFIVFCVIKNLLLCWTCSVSLFACIFYICSTYCTTLCWVCVFKLVNEFPNLVAFHLQCFHKCKLCVVKVVKMFFFHLPICCLMLSFVVCWARLAAVHSEHLKRENPWTLFYCLKSSDIRCLNSNT